VTRSRHDRTSAFRRRYAAENESSIGHLPLGCSHLALSSALPVNTTHPYTAIAELALNLDFPSLFESHTSASSL
jgi:hypothetical protein